MKTTLLAAMVVLVLGAFLTSALDVVGSDAGDKLGELQGLWVSDASPVELLQIRAGGRYRFYTLIPRYGVYAIGALGRISLTKDTASLMDTFGFESCDSDEIGIYRVRIESEDTLALERIEEPCSRRTNYLQPQATYRRAGHVEALVGAWISTDGEQMVVFGNDLTFELYNGSEQPGSMTIEAGIIWPDETQLYLTTDGGGSLNCGSLSPALYAFEIAENGTLTFEAKGDKCGDRRSSLEGHAFLRAEQIETIVGQWADEDSGEYKIDIHRDATYDLYRLTGESPKIVAQGRLWVINGQLQMEDWGGELSCPASQQGAYRITAQSRRLTIEATEDPCERRSSFYQQRYTWARVKAGTES